MKCPVVVFLPLFGICQLVATSESAQSAASTTFYDRVVRSYSANSDGILTLSGEGYSTISHFNSMAGPVAFSRDGAHFYLADPSFSVSPRICDLEDM